MSLARQCALQVTGLLDDSLLLLAGVSTLTWLRLSGAASVTPAGLACSQGCVPAVCCKACCHSRALHMAGRGVQVCCMGWGPNAPPRFPWRCPVQAATAP